MIIMIIGLYGKFSCYTKNMEKWLIYGLIASFFWGTSVIASKIASSNKYFNIDSSIVSLFMLMGIALVFVTYIFYEKQFKIPQSAGGIFFSILAGALWAIGMVATLRAIKSGADVARLTPIYNTNTLVAVILGIILLHELPQASQMVKVIVGAIMVVIGATLVAF